MRWGIRIAVVLLVFALGIALGQALDDNPDPGSPRDARTDPADPDDRKPGDDRQPLESTRIGTRV